MIESEDYVAARTAKSKRRPVRFPPAPGVYAFVDPRPNARRFVAQFACLVVNQSLRGCALVAIPTEKFEKGALVKVKLGPLSPVLAEVRWTEKLDQTVYKVGLLFLE